MGASIVNAISGLPKPAPAVGASAGSAETAKNKKTETATPPPGVTAPAVTYVPLSQVDIPDDLKQELMAALKNCPSAEQRARLLSNLQEYLLLREVVHGVIKVTRNDEQGMPIGLLQFLSTIRADVLADGVTITLVGYQPKNDHERALYKMFLNIHKFLHENREVNGPLTAFNRQIEAQFNEINGQAASYSGRWVSLSEARVHARAERDESMKKLESFSLDVKNLSVYEDRARIMSVATCNGIALTYAENNILTQVAPSEWNDDPLRTTLGAKISVVRRASNERITELRGQIEDRFARLHANVDRLTPEQRAELSELEADYQAWNQYTAERLDLAHQPDRKDDSLADRIDRGMGRFVKARKELSEKVKRVQALEDSICRDIGARSQSPTVRAAAKESFMHVNKKSDECLAEKGRRLSGTEEKTVFIVGLLRGAPDISMDEAVEISNAVTVKFEEHAQARQAVQEAKEKLEVAVLEVLAERVETFYVAVFSADWPVLSFEHELNRFCQELKREKALQEDQKVTETIRRPAQRLSQRLA